MTQNLTETIAKEPEIFGYEVVESSVVALYADEPLKATQD